MVELKQSSSPTSPSTRCSILLTGATASLRGSTGLSSFSVGKFGLRALGQCIAREYGPLGVHAAHIGTRNIITCRSLTRKKKKKEKKKARKVSNKNHSFPACVPFLPLPPSTAVVDGPVDMPLIRNFIARKEKASNGGGGGAKVEDEVAAAAAVHEAMLRQRLMQPTAIADVYFQLHMQDPSCWTQEIDLRPFAEPIFSRL